MKKIDAALAKAESNGTIDAKALAMKLTLIAAATVAGAVGTVLVKRAIDRTSTETE